MNLRKENFWYTFVTVKLIEKLNTCFLQTRRGREKDKRSRRAGKIKNGTGS